MIKVSIQGLGYVGSAMAVALASCNKNRKPIFDVTGIELNNKRGREKIKKINKAIFPFSSNDTEIKKLLKKIKKNKNLKATHQKESYKNTNVIIVSTGFGELKKNGNFLKELHIFKKNFFEILENINEGTLIIVETTLLPGTIEKIIYPKMKNFLIKKGIDYRKIYLAYSYERVMPGKNYIKSIKNYWRVYAGINETSSKKCELFLKKLINTKKFPLTKLDNITSVELSKIIENTYRAVNIAFIDEWSRFAEKIGVDMFKITEAIRKRSTHSNIRNPGFGVGGYCLTKDPLFGKASLKNIYNKSDIKFEFSERAVIINRNSAKRPFKIIKKFFKNNLKNKSILLLGATYREDIGDTRFSSSEVFYKLARLEGAKILVHDPMIKNWDEIGIKVHKKIPKFKKFDLIFFAVRHKNYEKIVFKKNFFNKNTLIFDSNNVLNSNQINQIKKNCISFLSIGRGNKK